jgi:hypothetical protein
MLEHWRNLGIWPIASVVRYGYQYQDTPLAQTRKTGCTPLGCGQVLGSRWAFDSRAFGIAFLVGVRT